MLSLSKHDSGIVLRIMLRQAQHDIEFFALWVNLAQTNNLKNLISGF